MADALKKNIKSQMCWASKEDHSKYFSLIKAVRKSPMDGTHGILKIFPNIIFQPINVFLDILSLAQDAANYLCLPSKKTMTPSSF